LVSTLPLRPFCLRATATSQIYTLSLHDALPISALHTAYQVMRRGQGRTTYKVKPGDTLSQIAQDYNVPIERLMEANNIRDPNKIDRKSTRLNSSHVKISYAVFCLKKKNKASKTK